MTETRIAGSHFHEGDEAQREQWAEYRAASRARSHTHGRRRTEVPRQPTKRCGPKHECPATSTRQPEARPLARRRSPLRSGLIGRRSLCSRRQRYSGACPDRLPARLRRAARPRRHPSANPRLDPMRLRVLRASRSGGSAGATWAPRGRHQKADWPGRSRPRRGPSTPDRPPRARLPRSRPRRIVAGWLGSVVHRLVGWARGCNQVRGCVGARSG
jgi:hypothetical protein